MLLVPKFLESYLPKLCTEQRSFKKYDIFIIIIFPFNLKFYLTELFNNMCDVQKL